MNILLIDSDLETMSLIKIWLGKRGHIVKYTGEEEEAGKLIEVSRPDVIILDEVKHEMAYRLKSENHTASIPIILMTSYRSPRPNQICDDYIPKPFHVGLLEHTLAKFTIIEE